MVSEQRIGNDTKTSSTRISPRTYARFTRNHNFTFVNPTVSELYCSLKNQIPMMNSDIQFRDATREDLPDIVRLLSDDPLGSQRESDTSPLPKSYYSAFEAIDRDSNNELVVVVSSGTIIGMLQLTFIPYLTYCGSWRALIEGIRIDRNFRSLGIGQKLIAWSIERSKQRGCHMIQLTSDKKRPDAMRFYERLGFVSSHEGLKLHLRSNENEPQRSEQGEDSNPPPLRS